MRYIVTGKGEMSIIRIHSRVDRYVEYKKERSLYLDEYRKLQVGYPREPFTKHFCVLLSK